VTVFEPATAQVLFTLRGAHAARPGAGGAVTAARLSHSGRLLATAGADAAVRLWDASDGALLAALAGHGAPPRALAWAPGDRALASGGGDATPRVWAAPHPPA
jgi:WD40 repeat protein